MKWLVQLPIVAWSVAAIVSLPLFLPARALAAAVVSPNDLTATEILSTASKRLADTPTVRFDLSVEGETFVDYAETIQLLSAKGDLVRPDQVHTEFKVKLLGSVTVSIELIIIGKDVWSTDLITGRWGKAPDEFAYNPSILFDNQEGIGPVMNRVQNAQRLDDGDLRDHKVFHVQAEVDQAIIGDLTAHTMTGSPVTVDLWIDRKTFDLIRARLSEPPSEGRDNPATWTLDLSKHGEQITIDPPS